MLWLKSGESVTTIFQEWLQSSTRCGSIATKQKMLPLLRRFFDPCKFNFVIYSKEDGNDAEELSIDELQSFLLFHEQKLIQQEKEEQALKALSKNPSTPSGADRGWGRGRCRGRRAKNNNDRGNQQQNHQHQESHSQGRGRGHVGHHSTKSADKSNVECHGYGRYGHCKFECRTNLNKDGRK